MTCATLFNTDTYTQTRHLCFTGYMSSVSWAEKMVDISWRISTAYK